MLEVSHKTFIGDVVGLYPNAKIKIDQALFSRIECMVSIRNLVLKMGQSNDDVQKLRALSYKKENQKSIILGWIHFAFSKEPNRTFEKSQKIY